MKYIIMLFAFASSVLCLAKKPEMKVQYEGFLVADPCVIAPGQEDIFLDFDNIVDKYLYLNERTPGKRIDIQLIECDLSLGNEVNITFNGIENSQLPGLLALSQGSDADGIAIGIETIDDIPLFLNEKSSNIPLSSGSNTLSFKVFVKGEPDAIKNKKISKGHFSAITQFNINYE
ncbi:TPA: fimbrial protein [Providencia alcalifaciens]|uniref:fimbrial protein n=1 Tax=Providencia alcalifaciens TaxID=126385 RepID=UPI002B0613A7|nr:fimbrial protein [Providencia alcalifaciens]